MGRKDRRPLRALAGELVRVHPWVEDPGALIEAGLVRVDGRVVTNPGSLVRACASIAVRFPSPLRGETKLRAALEGFDVRVAGRVALDVGAAAGGFTRALLDAGAARVYAVDAGFGQLLGSLRQSPRVITLERTNLADLDFALVPETIEVVTMDLSYLAVGAAAAQLETLAIAPDADLVALVKPMFELRLAAPPTAPVEIAFAVRRAQAGLATAGWRPVASLESSTVGGRGAVEAFVHARRDAGA